MFLGKNALIRRGVIGRGGLETDMGGRRPKARLPAKSGPSGPICAQKRPIVEGRIIV